MTNSRVLLLSMAMAIGTTPAIAGVSVGDKAPKINVGKWYNLPKGMKTIKAKDLKGQIVIVEFWATW